MEVSETLGARIIFLWMTFICLKRTNKFSGENPAEINEQGSHKTVSTFRKRKKKDLIAEQYLSNKYVGPGLP